MVTDQDLYAMRPVAARIDLVAEYCWQTTITRIDKQCVTYEQTLPTRYYFSGAVADVANCKLHNGWMSPIDLILCYFRLRPFEIMVPHLERVTSPCSQAAE